MDGGSSPRVNLSMTSSPSSYSSTLARRPTEFFDAFKEEEVRKVKCVHVCVWGGGGGGSVDVGV